MPHIRGNYHAAENYIIELHRRSPIGNELVRIILEPGTPSDAARMLAKQLRVDHPRPTTVIHRSLREKKVRRPELKAARDADIAVVDVDSTAVAAVLQSAAIAAIGDGRFLLRACDDEELDVAYPDRNWIERIYQTTALDWLLEPEQDPIPWVNSAFYAIPSNPPDWDETVPIMATLLRVAFPGQARACPICNTNYVSHGGRGQCPSCGFVAFPFLSTADAFAWERVPLDAFAWGQCGRCRKRSEFAAIVQQCSRCGRLMEGDGSFRSLLIPDNRPQIAMLLNALNPEP